MLAWETELVSMYSSNVSNIYTRIQSKWHMAKIAKVLFLQGGELLQRAVKPQLRTKDGWLRASLVSCRTGI